MDQKEIYQYQILQIIVFYLLRQPELFLQPEKWPLEIDRQLFFTYLTNLLNLEYKEDLSELLTNAFQRITEILTNQTKEQSIPPQLNQIVENYEEYLNQLKEQIKQKPSYWEYYQQILENISKQQPKNPRLTEAISLQTTYTLTSSLPSVSPQNFQKIVPPEEYLKILKKTIEASGIKLPPKELSSLAKKTYPSAAQLANIPRLSPVPPTTSIILPKLTSSPKISPPPVSSTDTGLAEIKLTQLTNAISGLSPEGQSLAKNIASRLEKEIIKTVIAGKPLSINDYSQLVSQVTSEISKTQGISPQLAGEIEKVLKTIGPQIVVSTTEAVTTLQQITEVLKIQPEIATLSPEKTQTFLETAKTGIAPLSLNPQPPSAEEIEQVVSQVFKETGTTLPQEQIRKIETTIINNLILKEKTQGVAFKPIFTLLHPPTTISFAKKTVLTPIVKPLQWMVKIAPENIPEEIKKAILEGLTSKDVQESIKTLQETGISPIQIDQLKNLQERLILFEKSHSFLSFLLSHYHEYSKKINSRQIQEPETNLWLPKLFPSTPWQKQKGYAWFLRRGLNRLGVFLKTHQWLPSLGGKIIRFVLPDKIVRFITFGKIQSFNALKKVARQKIIQPVLVWLGKTAIGKTIKSGAKKLASWGLSKLGISLAGAAAGAAAGPPGWVVALISFLPNIVSWVKRGFKKLLEKPKLAIILGVGLVGLPILVPMLPALGFIFTAAGIISAGIGLLSKGGDLIAGIASKIGSFLSNAASTVSGLFSSLSTISLPSSLPIIAVGGGIGATTVLTLTTVITIGSAFLKEGKGEAPPYIGSPVSPRAPAEAEHLAEEVVWTLRSCGITAVNKKTWQETKDCLNNSALPNKREIINQFRYSVFEVGPGLQCVGFVRGVMAALGKDPGGNRHARDYLNPPTPPGYYPVDTNMNNIKIGDLVIWKGGTYGHIAIVVNIVEKNEIKYLHIAEAIGTNNGVIRINEVNAVYFNGFLRPT